MSHYMPGGIYRSICGGVAGYVPLAYAVLLVSRVHVLSDLGQVTELLVISRYFGCAEMLVVVFYEAGPSWARNHRSRGRKVLHRTVQQAPLTSIRRSLRDGKGSKTRASQSTNSCLICHKSGHLGLTGDGEGDMDTTLARVGGWISLKAVPHVQLVLTTPVYWRYRVSSNTCNDRQAQLTTRMAGRALAAAPVRQHAQVAMKRLLR